MIVPNMLSMMNIALEDLKKKDLPPALLLELLNNGQDRLIAKLNRNIIRTLDTSATSQSLNSTTGAFDLSTLTYEVWRKTQGIDGIKLTDGRTCARITYQEFKMYTKTVTIYEPIYYIRGTTIYVQPYDSQTIDIYYRREPATIRQHVASGSIEAGVTYYVHNYTTVTYNEIEYTDGETFVGVSGTTTYTATGTGYVCVNSELEDHLHMMLVGLSLEKFITRSDLSRIHYESALREIEEMNDSDVGSDALLTGKYSHPSGNDLAGSSAFNILTGS